MQLEFHQLERRWERLRARHPARQRRLLASLAEVGQQTPIVVVAAEGQANRYVVIDGYKRIAALEQDKTRRCGTVCNETVSPQEMAASNTTPAPKSTTPSVHLIGMR